MNILKILLNSKKTIIVQDCKIADTFSKRFKGLMGKKTLEEGKGLYITKCNSIHMFFMKFPIDVIFLDKNKTIVHLLQNFKPWKIQFPIKRAADTLELPAGTIKKYNINLGDILSLE